DIGAVAGGTRDFVPSVVTDRPGAQHPIGPWAIIVSLCRGCHTTSLLLEVGDTPLGLKPGGFSGLSPSDFAGVRSPTCQNGLFPVCRRDERIHTQVDTKNRATAARGCTDLADDLHAAVVKPDFSQASWEGNAFRDTDRESSSVAAFIVR